MNGGNFRVASVRSWPVRAAGDCTAALCRPGRRTRLAAAQGWSQTRVRRVTKEAATTGITREGVARSALGPGPNQRPAAHRGPVAVLFKPKGCGWAARAEGCR